MANNTEMMVSYNGR